VKRKAIGGEMTIERCGDRRGVGCVEIFGPPGGVVATGNHVTGSAHSMGVTRIESRTARRAALSAYRAAGSWRR
jgi:hypothetical protein